MMVTLMILGVFIFLIVTIVTENPIGGIAVVGFYVLLIVAYVMISDLTMSDVQRYDVAKATCDSKKGELKQVDKRQYTCTLSNGMTLRM